MDPMQYVPHIEAKSREWATAGNIFGVDKAWKAHPSPGAARLVAAATFRTDTWRHEAFLTATMNRRMVRGIRPALPGSAC